MKLGFTLTKVSGILDNKIGVKIRSSIIEGFLIILIRSKIIITKKTQKKNNSKSNLRL